MRRLAIWTLVAALSTVCTIASAASAQTTAPEFFQRYSPPDLEQLETDIRELRQELRTARAAGNRDAALRATADLGERLTTARREEEARSLLSAALSEARPLGSTETLGWLLLNLATANQYAGRRDEAAAQFPEALALSRHLGLDGLEHYVLHHWGRFLAEEGDTAQARARFAQALEIRIRLRDPRQASSRRALDALGPRSDTLPTPTAPNRAPTP